MSTSKTPKTLLVFCDGTAQDGSTSDPNAGTPGDQGQEATNVLRLAHSVLPYDKSGNRQIVFYQSGVGSESDFDGKQITTDLVSQALGTAVASKIRDAYVFLAQNFEEGDDICLFGFSRGAYTARKLSGLIDAIGLLSRQNLTFFFEVWRALNDGDTPPTFPDTRFPTQKLVGVWDTVGSVFNQSDTLHIKDTSLPATVKVAIHAISLHENRQRFLPTLWTIPSGGLKPDQVLKQVWFAGAHSDVGGGYDRHELSDITLFWMAGENLDLVNLDLDFLRGWAQVRPDPWGTSQPHNAFVETNIALQPVMGHETRLESGQLTSDAVFHSSVQFSPQKLDSPLFMITMSDVQKKFGSGFQTQYAPLNSFEQSCKNDWGSGQLGDGNHGIETPDVMFLPKAILVGMQKTRDALEALPVLGGVLKTLGSIGK
ncbi:hypothetical protein D9758_018900 [Tetrapyrgos nigripes]|uniref:T6SS Phospholipase effector Tle1-like catalytic domain-containing protein n=1 Tax=Tetrapyrgos nigripes TaxID=182062 RepID=A0A8H5AQZ5_9AGAR|nr:hypothetical protein D9758_018900 [Tetrapyrgos nigripes]